MPRSSKSRGSQTVKSKSYAFSVCVCVLLLSLYRPCARVISCAKCYHSHLPLRFPVDSSFNSMCSGEARPPFLPALAFLRDRTGVGEGLCGGSGSGSGSMSMRMRLRLRISMSMSMSISTSRIVCIRRRHALARQSRPGSVTCELAKGSTGTGGDMILHQHPLPSPPLPSRRVASRHFTSHHITCPHSWACTWHHCV